MSQGVGFAPAVAVAVKAVPAIIGLFGGKDKAEAEARMAQYQAAEQQIMSGQAVMATDVMTAADKDFLRRVWPQIHAAAQWDHISWPSIGYPNGPPLTPGAIAAIKNAWPTVHVAAQFDHVNWQYHAVPLDVVAPAMPLPELGYKQPAVAGPLAPPVGYPSNFQPGQLFPPSQVTRAGAVFDGLSPGLMLAIGGSVVLGLILFSGRR